MLETFLVAENNFPRNVKMLNCNICESTDTIKFITFSFAFFLCCITHFCAISGHELRLSFWEFNRKSNCGKYFIFKVAFSTCTIVEYFKTLIMQKRSAAGTKKATNLLHYSMRNQESNVKYSSQCRHHVPVFRVQIEILQFFVGFHRIFVMCS